MTGNDDDRKPCVFPGEMCLHVEPVHVRHVQIEKDATRQARLERLQKFRAGAERLHAQAGGTHQAHQCFADGFFVVNDSDARMSFGHSVATVRQSRQSAQLDLRLLYLSMLYFRLASPYQLSVER